jgi:CDP-glycerol glycerophosphotransferase (TagB/SpsB family)
MPRKRYLFYISQNYSYAILRPLQQKIWARGDEVVWFLEGKEVDERYLHRDEVQLNTIDDAIKYQPIAVFVPGNVVPNFISGLKVAIFHGFNSGKLNRRGFEDHFKIRGCFDLYCTQGINTTQQFQCLAKKYKHFTVKETGWSALDPLFNDAKSVEHIKPTVLMCSTFSRHLTCAPILFDKIKALSRQGKWNWIIQFHPKMPTHIIEQYKSIQNKHLTFIETDNVIPLLQQADVMVCDTSSVLMMFLLLNKPVVTFKNISPKDYLIDISDADKLAQAIEYALVRPKKLMRKIARFINETHPYSDGKSSERVLAAVDELLVSNIPLKKKPLNLIRNFKLRKKLGYWKFL